MSCCQNHWTHESLIATSYTLHLIILEQNGIHLRLEVHFTSTTDDGIAHRLDDVWQLVRTQMWMSIRQNTRAGSMLAKHIQNLLHIATFLASRIELAV